MRYHGRPDADPAIVRPLSRLSRNYEKLTDRNFVAPTHRGYYVGACADVRDRFDLGWRGLLLLELFTDFVGE